MFSKPEAHTEADTDADARAQADAEGHADADPGAQADAEGHADADVDVRAETGSSTTVRLDQLPDGILVVRADGLIVDANTTFLGLVGRAREEVVGRRFEHILAEEDIVRLLGSESFLMQDSVHESSLIFSSMGGEARPLLTSFTRASGAPDILMVVREHGALRAELQDASRWMATEQERSEQARRAHHDLEAKNSVLSATQAELEKAYQKLQEGVTARERLETELRLAHRLEAMGQLAAGLAHEINTPMQYIGDNASFLDCAIAQLANFATAVRRTAVEASSAKEMIACVEESAQQNDLDYVLEETPHAISALRDGVEQVSKIIRAMKSFVRADQVEKAPADLNQALRDTLVVARGEYKHVLSVETEFGDIPAVTCLVSALNQAFLNLIVNAAHAVSEAKRTDGGRLRLTTAQKGDFVEIAFSDNGCGIPEPIQHRIFDQFFTTKPVGLGTGQGLGIVRRIVVEMHGGTVAFKSEPGQGTTFVLTIPIEAAPSSQETPALLA